MAWCLIIAIICYLTIGIIHSEFTSSLIGTARILTLLVFTVFLRKFYSYSDFFNGFYRFSVIAALCTIVAFIISIFFPSGFRTFANPDEREAVNFLLSNSNAIYQFGSVSFARMSFYFDEPGTLAMVLSFAVLIGWNDKPAYLNVILLTAGILTLSIAFYFVIGVFFVIRFLNKANFKEILLFITLASLSIFLIINSDIFIVMDKLILGRFDSIMSGGAGNTRKDVLLSAFEYFSLNPIYGVGFNTNGQFDFFGANLLYFLAIGGLIFLPLYLPVLVVFLINMFNANYIFSFLMLALFFQRPDFLLPYGYVCLLLCWMFGLKKRFKNV